MNSNPATNLRRLLCAAALAVGAFLGGPAMAAPSGCATPGKDGTAIITAGTIIDSYYPGSGTSTSNTVTVGTKRAGSAAANIAAGDLVLIMQMQDGSATDFGTAAATYGTNTSTAGLYEYATVQSVAGAVVTFDTPLTNTYRQNYGNRQIFQVIRVPQYSSVTVSGTISPLPWTIDASGNGTGGVLAMDVAGALTLNANLDAKGLGFRGAGTINAAVSRAGGAFNDQRYPSSTNNGASKGEGTAGTPVNVFNGTAAYSTYTSNYTNGDNGQGAPGNAGGGGNDGDPAVQANGYNSGGGGGSNAGAGGVGGLSWNSGNLGVDAGGRGARATTPSATRVFLGGGGGAGSSNNNGNTNAVTTYPPNATGGGADGPVSSSGASGGGIILVRSQTFSGAGQIDASGNRAYNVSGGSEAAGAGGAGGSVVVRVASGGGSPAINVSGGRGGNANYYRHGPGGGGGGGFISTSSNLSPVNNIAGGAQGIDSTTGAPGGYTPVVYGSAAGSGGAVITPAPPTPTACFPVLTVTKTTSTINRVQGSDTIATYSIVVTNTGGPADGVSITDALPAPFSYTPAASTPIYAGGASGPASVTGSGVNTVVFGTAGGTAANSFSIPFNGSVTLTFNVNLNSAAAGTYQNPATTTFTDPTRTAAQTVSPGGAYTNTGTAGGSNYASGSSTGEDVIIAPRVDLSVTKTVNDATPAVGSTIIFTVTVSNAPNLSNATGVSVDDLLPAGYTYVSSTPSIGTYVNGTGVWTVGTIASGSSANITITATVNAAGPYANTATATSTQTELTPANNTQTNTPSIRPTATNVTFSSMPSSAGPTTISSLAATDADGTIATYTVSTLPPVAQGILYLADGVTAVTAGQVLTPAQAAGLRFDPSGTFNGNATFTFTATDNTGLVDLTPATYTVVVTNTPPVATDITNPSIPSTAGATTISSLAATDSDGTIASFTVSTLPPVAQGILYLADGTTAVTVGQVLTLAQASSLRFDPSGTFTGSSTFTFTATDNNGVTDATPATFTIPIGNNPPNALNVTNANVPINAGPTTLATGLAATDTDGTIASYTVSTLPPAAQGVLYLADGITAVTAGQVLTPAQAAGLRFDPSGTFNGNVTFTYAATDNLGAVDATPATYMIPVVNNPPVATDVTNATIPSAAGPTTISSLAATDTDGTIASYTVSTLPAAAQGTLFLADGITAVTAGQVLTPAQAGGLRFDPSGTFTGNSTFTFTATDNNGAVDATPATFTIPVGNNPPVAGDVTTTPSINANAGATTISSLSATDTDGTIATYTVSTLPPVAQGILYLADGVTAVTAGQVLTPAQAAGLRFDPSGTFAGNVTFTYTATDNNGAVDATPATYTIPVVNTPPVANDVTSTPAIPSSAGPSSISALSATDTDGTIATYTVSTLPAVAQGILYLTDGITAVTAGQVLTPVQAAGLRFDPSGTFNGNVTFTFTATDNTGAVDATPATFTIPVTNTPPIASDVTNATSIPASAGPTTISSLAATDADGTVVSYTVSTLPPAAQGILYLADGITAVTAGQVLTPAQAAGLRFDPSGTFNGNVTFTYTATDNQGAVDATPATYTIPLGNVPPVAQDITNPAISIAAGPTTISSLVATDADGTIASYTVSTLPLAAQGTLFLADGITAVTAGQVLTPTQASSLRFDPSGTFVGNVTFTYTATDNNGSVDASPATFTIPVTNTPPTATNVTAATIPSTAGPTTISSLAATDTDGTIASYTVSTLPPAAQGVLYLADGITVVTTGQVLTPAQAAGLRFDPSGTFTGNSTFTFTATDNNGAVDATPATYTIPVGNNPPTAVDTTNATIPSTAGPTTISSLSATDTDGTIVSYTVSTLPPAGQGTLFLADGLTAVTAGQILTPAQAAGLRFDPSGTFTGNSTFTFTATDNNGAVDATPATYTVPVGNNPPTAVDTTTAAIPGNAGPTTISSLNATDTDGTVVSYTVSTLPAAAQGTLFLADGVTAVTAGQVLTPAQAAGLRFDPSGTFAGNATFTFTVTDNLGAVDATPATYTIPISNTPPVATDVTNPAINDNAGPTTISSLAATDVDGTVVSYTVSTLPSVAQGILYLADGITAVTAGQILTPAQAAGLRFDPSGTFVGNASFTFTATDNAGAVDATPATFTIPVTSAIDLSVTKTSSPANPPVGSAVTFTVTVSNAANLSVATGVAVTDLLPSGYTFVSSTASQGSYASSTGVWTVGIVASGSSANIQIVGTVLGSGTYANTAQVTAAGQTDVDSTPNDGAGDDFATNTPTPAPRINLSMTKTATPANPSVGSNVTFTLTVANAANLNNATGVAVRDQLPSGYTYVSDNGALAYVPATGIWTVGTVNVGSSKSLQIVATVKPTGVYKNDTEVTAADQIDTNSLPNDGTGDDFATVTPGATPVADLSLTKAASSATPAVGSNVTFTVTVTNAGPSTATGVAVTDQLPSGYTFVSSTPSQGTYVSGTGIWTIGNINPISSVTLQITATVRATGVYGNTAQVSAVTESDPDSTPNNNAPLEDDQQTNTPVPSPRIDLSALKTVNNAAPAVGSDVTFTVTLANAANLSTATGVSLTDQLPSGYTYVSHTASQGTYTPGTGLWTVGSVNSGSSVTLSIVATVRPSGIYGNTAQVTTANETDINSTPNNNDGSENDQSTSTPVPSPRVDLSLTKVSNPANPAVGSTVTFTLTVANAGPSIATGVAVTDQLPSGYSFLSSSPSQGAYTSGTGVWSVGTVNASGTATLTINATVLASGTYANTAQVTAAGETDLDSTPNNNLPAEDDQATDTPTPSPRADLRVGKTVTPANPAIGADATFTVTVSNNGPSTATGVIVTDGLPSGYTFVSATPSQGTYDAGTGIWTVGSIANAGNATLTIVGTVRSSGAYTNSAEVTASGVIDPTSTPNDGTGDDRDSVGITPAGFSTLSGRVYADVNLSGADNTEPGIGGVSMTLTGTDISGNPVSVSATTDGTGAFSFAGLPPSNASGYTITQTQPANYSSGATTNGTPAGTIGINAISNIVVAANTSGTGYAFGEQRADISVVKTASNTTPAVGSFVSFTVTASNAGPTNASGVVITDALPTGYTYISDTGAGAYVPATGLWTVGNLAASGNAVLTITARVNPSGNYANTAQLTSSNQADPNSTPNNNNPAEDDQSTSSLTPVATIDLSVTKTSSPATPAVGTNVTFLVTVTNAAALSTATGVQITDLLPSGYNFVSATPSSGTYNAATGLWTLGSLNSGSSATLSVVAQVLPTGTYANTAQVTTADQPDADSTPNDGTGDDFASDTPAPSPRADLSLSKTVSNTAPNIGSNVSFTVTLNNAGPSAATGVTIRDLLPSGFTFVSATPSGATTYVSGTGIWTVPSIASATNETLTIIATVRPSGNYTNVAEVTSSGVTDPDSTPNDATGDDFATAGVTPAGLSGLTGRVYADVNLSGTDNTEPGIQGVTVTLTGTDANGLVVSQTTTTDATGAYTFAGLLPPQAATTYALTQTQPANYSGTVSNVGTGAGGTAGSNQVTGISFPSGTAATGYSFAEQRADLSVTKSASTTNPNVGTNVTFTVNVSNAGPTNASGVVVADALPSGFTLVGVPTSSAGTYAAGVWTVGALGSGATQTLTITASVNASGDYTNIAQLTASNQADPNSTPNNNNPAEDDQSAAPLTPTPVADIAVTKTGPAQVAGGASVTYTVTVVNNGPSSANNVVVTDTFPSALTGVTASNSGVVTSSTVTWTLPTLAVGTPVSFTVTGTAPTTGTLVNLVSGSSSTLDTTPNNNDSNPANDPVGSPSSVTTQVVSAPTVAKSFSPNPIPAGGVSTLTVRLTNPNNTALTGASITDPLPSGLTPVAGTAATTCGGIANQTVSSLTLTGGTIPANGNCTLTVQVRPSSSASGKGAQVNTIPAGALTTNQSPASPAPATATLDIASVGAAKSASIPVNNGDGTYSVTYTVTLENLGSVGLTDVQAVENLSATFPSPATFVIQTAPVSGAGLTVNPAFNGSSNTNLLTAASSSLAVGVSRTTVFTVRVTPGATPPATTFSNSVTVTATGPSGLSVSDVSSNSGTDPDPNGNGNPNDPGEGNSTPVNFSENPAIGVAKQAAAPVSNGDGSYTVPLTVVVRNYGDVPLISISALENLSASFGTALVSSSVPTLVAGSAGTVTPNPAFTGTGANTDLIAANSSLAVNASATFTFSVVIRPTPAASNFSNNVTAQGNSPAGTPVTDNSANGTNPDPDGDGNPTNNTAITPIAFGIITGQIFTDTNGDGAQQVGEPNLTGTTVTITPTGGTPFTVTTNSAGVYNAVVPAGSTSADVTDPAATILTTANDPQTRVVTAGATATNTPVGFQAKAGLVGRVFTDTNGNGVQDPGEAGIAGLTVTVTPIGGGAAVTTTTTNSSGDYTVAGLAAGQYSANVTDPANTILTTANDPQTVTVAPNGAGSARPVGFQPTATVVGRVFRDDNGNGSQASTETGLAGVQVRITNGSFVSIVTTDANGDYTLSGVPIGTATVDIVNSTLPVGVTQTAGTDPSVVTVLAGVSNSAGADGYRLPAPVATNNAATTTVDKPVTFPITADDSATSPLTVIASSIDLDPSTPGEDKIRIVPEGKYTANSDGTVTFEPNTGVIGSVTPIQYTVKDSSGNLSNAATLAVTIGAATLGDVTGDVFNDLNGNGIKDAGEGLAGVQVTVTSGAAVQTVTTNATGVYTALGLPAGTATVDIVNSSLPAGLTQTVGTDPSTVTVVAGTTVNAGLDGYRAAPPVAVGDTANTPFNTTVTFPITGNDTASGGNTVTPATVDLDPSTPAEDKTLTVPEGSFTVDALGNVTFTPTTGFTGVVPSINYTVKDSSGQLSNTAPIGVTVGSATTGVVRGIVYRDDNGNGLQDGSEPGLSGVSVVITPASGPSVTAITDSSGNYSAANIPLGNATVDITDSSLPAGAFATVAGADPTTISVVLGSNDAGLDGYRLPRPVANDDNATTPVNTPVTFTITGNDTASTPYTVVPSSVDLDPATAGLQTSRTVPEGIYAVNGVGEVTFTPTTGFSGNATPITYTVRGSVGQTSNQATIRVIVTPTAANDTATTDLNTPVTIPVLSNDVGSLLLASVVFPATGQPSGSSVSPDFKTLTVPGVGVYAVNSSGAVIFTPTNGYSGNAPVVLYSVSDGVTTRTASIGVTVTSQTVTGKIFTDTNGNGVQDAGEPNTAGATVTITDSLGGTQVVTTDPNGNYTATVPVGGTTITVTTPTGTTLTTANNPQTVNVPAGGATAAPIGFQPKATIAGVIFADTNGNGLQDAGEPGISGATVTITPVSGGAPVTVTTDPNGNYSAPNLPLGNYTVSTGTPANTSLTTGNNPQAVTLPAGGASATPIGFRPVTSGGISGKVFNDANGTGVLEAGEVGLSGATVSLYEVKPDGTPDLTKPLKDASGQPITAITDASGNYSFSSIPSGPVAIVVTDPSGKVLTTANNPQVVTVPSGTSVTAAAVGYVTPKIDLTLTPGVTVVTPGDNLPYTAVITNNTPGTITPLNKPVFSVTLPKGVIYDPTKPVTVDGVLIPAGSISVKVDPADPSRQILTINLPNSLVNNVAQTVKFNTVVTPAVDANKPLIAVGQVTATAGAGVTAVSVSSNAVAAAAVGVNLGVFSTDTIILGRVYFDKNDNNNFDAGDVPLPGARVYLSDGRYAVADSEGRYNITGVKPGTYAVRLDPVTAPYAPKRVPDDQGAPGTRYVNANQGGGISHEDFPLETPLAVAVKSRSTVVQRGPVTLEKSITQGGAGYAVTYTITVTKAVSNLAITDPLPANAERGPITGATLDGNVLRFAGITQPGTYTVTFALFSAAPPDLILTDPEILYQEIFTLIPSSPPQSSLRNTPPSNDSASILESSDGQEVKR